MPNNYTRKIGCFNNKLSIFFVGIASILMISSAQAEMTNQNTLPAANQQIATQMKSFAESFNSDLRYTRVAYDVTLPDPRLNLESCQAPLNIENRSQDRTIGRLTIRVACENATKPWALNLSMHLIAFDNVVVASRPIPKGSKITRSMLTIMERDVSRLHQGYFTQLEHVLGSVSKYAISGNKALKPGNLLPATLVSKGEKVVINAVTSGLNIRASGVALSDGALGELIRVKNSQTRRIIEGRVSAAGQITVSL